MTVGVPYGSVIGQLLWITMYDGVLQLQLPNRSTIVGFADDIAIGSVAKTVREIEEKTNIAIRKVRAWLGKASLTLAAHKTEAVLISNQKIVKKMRSKRAIKYLRVIIDDRLNFKKHVTTIGEKASVTQGALTKMMPNIGGPNPLKRRIISKVVTSIILHPCPIWTEALSVGTTRRKLSSMYCLSVIIQIIGFRTVSDETVLVLPKTILIDILADEMGTNIGEYPRQTTAATKAEEQRTSIHK